MRNRGFTMVEILVVIAILSIVGVILVQIFYRSIQGGNKSTLTSTIKQNGQSVLNTIDKSIRNSDGVICISSSKQTMALVKNGVYTRYRLCTKDNSCRDRNFNTNPGNGFIESDTPIVAANESLETIINDVCDEQNLMSLTTNVVTLTDTNTKTGVSLVDGEFTRSKAAGFKDIITIRYQLGAGNDVPSVFSQLDPVEFKTTVELR
jgi:prepilin-type N-terminal cleavage/methylation domain-containing protein